MRRPAAVRRRVGIFPFRSMLLPRRALLKRPYFCTAKRKELLFSFVHEQHSHLFCTFAAKTESMPYLSTRYATSELYRKMKQRHIVIVLFALILASSLASLDSYWATSQRVHEDMNRALAIALQKQQCDVISQDTIRSFNSHLQIAALRGKATLTVETRGRTFKPRAECSEATIFSLSDQRPAALLWLLSCLLAMYLWHRRRLALAAMRSVSVGIAAGSSVSAGLTAPSSVSVGIADGSAISGSTLGLLTYAESDSRFYAADGTPVRLTPMQHQLMEMFFRASSHSLSKAEICSALWPKKPDASETLYTLIRRLRPVIEGHYGIKIESDRGRAYSLTTN